MSLGIAVSGSGFVSNMHLAVIAKLPDVHLVAAPEATCRAHLSHDSHWQSRRSDQGKTRQVATHNPPDCEVTRPGGHATLQAWEGHGVEPFVLLVLGLCLLGLLAVR